MESNDPPHLLEANAALTNPYAAPMAPLEDMSETGALGFELADRGTRLGACFCDAFIWGSLGFIASNFVN
ncbi:MAG TPA: hypothetical protein VFF77_05335, partial [Holophagaceae bacterium]|nr:hypothetical protein [Holophagaceae bacterium]